MARISLFWSLLKLTHKLTNWNSYEEKNTPIYQRGDDDTLYWFFFFQIILGQFVFGQSAAL